MARLYKFFTEQCWADAFLRGELRFSPLSYFCGLEDGQVREDEHEGVSVYRPHGGLKLNFVDRPGSQLLEGFSLNSTAKKNEIYVFCMTRSNTDELWKRFKAVACVEIRNIPAFCSRVEAALPSHAKFPRPITGRKASEQRIGNKVRYYDPSESPGTRYALPDLMAISKARSYDWQNEFRLTFTITDAFEFQNASFEVTNGTSTNPPETKYEFYLVTLGNLSDIAKLLRVPIADSSW